MNKQEWRRLRLLPHLYHPLHSYLRWRWQPQLSPSKTQPVQTEPEGKADRKRYTQQPKQTAEEWYYQEGTISSNNNNKKPTSKPSGRSNLKTIISKSIYICHGCCCHTGWKGPTYGNIHCTHPQVSGYILYKDLRERNLESLEGLTSPRSMW